jgi:molybdopterin-guanine dinucleotide biosynthesis protein A/molybdopterin converting factor small subunit
MKGLVLTGGKSSRMGTPKAELNHHGEPEFVRCYKLLKTVCDEVFLSTSEFWSPKADFDGAVLLPDLESRGPLSGISAAFSREPNAAFIVLACDMPHFGKDALAQLCHERDASLQATCFALDGKTPEPLCAIYEAGSAAAIQEALAKDIRCARRVLDSMAIKRVFPSSPEWVRNINEKLNVDVEFMAQLRESAGKSFERVTTYKTTPRALYEDLRLQYGFLLTWEHMRVAVNDHIVDWEKPLNENDRVMFVPPVAGG